SSNSITSSLLFSRCELDSGIGRVLFTTSITRFSNTSVGGPFTGFGGVVYGWSSSGSSHSLIGQPPSATGSMTEARYWVIRSQARSLAELLLQTLHHRVGNEAGDPIDAAELRDLAHQRRCDERVRGTARDEQSLDTRDCLIHLGLLQLVFEVRRHAQPFDD